MSSKRLGKGINAIIKPKTKKNNSSAKSATAPGVSKVKLKDIYPNPDQPRRDFDEQSLDQLSQSIKKKGIITPLTLRKQNDGYEIILNLDPTNRDSDLDGYSDGLEVKSGSDPLDKCSQPRKEKRFKAPWAKCNRIITKH